MISKEEAVNHLFAEVQDEGLRSHCESVARVMEFLAHHFQQSTESQKWYVAGLLHDADWEMHPKSHPRTIVAWLSNRGEHEIAHAISAHGVSWGVEHETLMDKALVATDELCGFIIAYARVRPGGIEALSASKVVKELKDTSFAAGVDRREITEGVKILGVSIEQHADLIIRALKQPVA